MLTIATCRAYPQPPASLNALADELANRRIPARFDIWQNRPHALLLLPLCAWDYAAEPQAFAGWINEAAQAGCRFANPPALMLWNMHKSYLCSLAAQGINTIPTLVIEADAAALMQALQANRWPEAVIKPAVGQSGRHVTRISAGGALPDLAPYAQGAVVQPFIAAVQYAGELSMIFFNGRFSHAVRRQPAAGEWRANSAYGVGIFPADPPRFALSAAQQVLAALPATPAYARIDGTIDNGRFLLNELELIEPALYLDHAAGAAARFADTLAGLATGTAGG